MTFEGYPAPPDINFVAMHSEMSAIGVEDVADMTMYMRQQSKKAQDDRRMTTSRATMHAWAKRFIRAFKQNNDGDSTEQKLKWVRFRRRMLIRDIRNGWSRTKPLFRRKIRPVLRWQFMFFAWFEYQLTLEEIGELL